MSGILNHVKHLDWVLLGAAALVFVMGLLIFYGSATDHDLFWRQLLFGGIGFALIIILSFFDWRILRENSFLVLALYGAGLAALFLLFAAGEKTRGVISWFKFGAFNFEPVELVKIILAVVLAKYLSSRFIELHKWKNILVSSLYTALPAGLVLAQPDLGSAVILVILWFGLILVAGIKTRQFLWLMLALAVALGLMWNYVLADYQKTRITSFLYPEADPLGGSYQSRQSLIAVASGGFGGKGIGQGTQIRLGFLPEYQTDFIFAAIAEELGLVGVTVLLVGWFLIFFRLYRTMITAPDNFSKLFIAGLAIILGAHFGVNIGANLGFLPITGLPLPFVSHGGSSLISLAIGLGLVQAIRARIQRRSFGTGEVFVD